MRRTVGQMGSARGFTGRVVLITGILLLLFIWPLGNIGPTFVKNFTFIIFGVALTVFAFTYKRSQ